MNTTQKTYLPVFGLELLYRSLVTGDYEGLFEQKRHPYPFERIGLDRLLAIKNDLELLDIRSPSAILDVGCNVGLFSWGLACLGYHVTGIDNNSAQIAQGYYPQDIGQIARSIGNTVCNPNALIRPNFIEDDIENYLHTIDQAYDVVLLLSVVHQWVHGYADSSTGKKDPETIKQILSKLASRTRYVIYLETVNIREVDITKTIDLPYWFLKENLAASVTPICSSPSASGLLRELYRVELNANYELRL